MFSGTMRLRHSHLTCTFWLTKRTETHHTGVPYSQSSKRWFGWGACSTLACHCGHARTLACSHPAIRGVDAPSPVLAPLHRSHSRSLHRPPQCRHARIRLRARPAAFSRPAVLLRRHETPQHARRARRAGIPRWRLLGAALETSRTCVPGRASTASMRAVRSGRASSTAARRALLECSPASGRHRGSAAVAAAASVTFGARACTRRRGGGLRSPCKSSRRAAGSKPPPTEPTLSSTGRLSPMRERRLRRRPSSPPTPPCCQPRPAPTRGRQLRRQPRHRWRRRHGVARVLCLTCLRRISLGCILQVRAGKVRQEEDQPQRRSGLHETVRLVAGTLAGPRSSSSPPPRRGGGLHSRRLRR